MEKPWRVISSCDGVDDQYTTLPEAVKAAGEVIGFWRQEAMAAGEWADGVEWVEIHLVTHAARVITQDGDDSSEGVEYGVVELLGNEIAEELKALREALAGQSAEVERLTRLNARLLDGEIPVCGDCDGTGWLENRVEGRYACTCMSEAEPYQILESEVKRLDLALSHTACPECREVTGENMNRLTVERDALAAGIGRVAVSAGIAINAPMTGPELLLMLESLTGEVDQLKVENIRYKKKCIGIRIQVGQLETKNAKLREALRLAIPVTEWVKDRFKSQFIPGEVVLAAGDLSDAAHREVGE